MNHNVFFYYRITKTFHKSCKGLQILSTSVCGVQICSKLFTEVYSCHHCYNIKLFAYCKFQVISEVLTGIRVIKFYAWEKHFSSKIFELRSVYMCFITLCLIKVSSICAFIMFH